jgi:hypothetical protein
VIAMRIRVSLRSGWKGLLQSVKAKIGAFDDVRSVELYKESQLVAVVYIDADDRVTVGLSNEPMTFEVLSKGELPQRFDQPGDRKLYRFTQ